MAARLERAVPVIPDRLYFVSRRAKTLEDTQQVAFINTDEMFEYQPFFTDFGPLNLGHLVAYCRLMDETLGREEGRRAVYHWTTFDPKRRANACYLLGAYAILRHGRTAEEAAALFRTLSPPVTPFRDAAVGPNMFPLQLAEVLRGVHRAMTQGWVDVATFDVDKYLYLERVEHGDINWVVPGKVLAFSGPLPTRTVFGSAYTLTPEDYIDYFKANNVTAVVRLNKRMYDARRFEKNGIRHFDLIFTDGGIPSMAQVTSFLRIVESEPGAVAVHCKAGLGRTGTMICSYLIYKYHFTAPEAISWNRICRPGSVIGQQQQYLVSERPRQTLVGGLPVGPGQRMPTLSGVRCLTADSTNSQRALMSTASKQQIRRTAGGSATQSQVRSAAVTTTSTAARKPRAK
eukprot:m51a1_g9061 putative dual specificity protein phosphatase cdc14a (402) ;mRNA; f:76882-78759